MSREFARAALAALAAPGITATLCACGSMSGLQATSEYACKAPAGVKCDSVSGTYYNALQNNLPVQRQQHAPAPGAGAAPSSLPLSAPTGTLPAPAVADPSSTQAVASIRSQPKVLRLWIKPWEDSDRDLHDQGYVYVQVDPGRWLVDHAQRQIREAFAPLRAPRAAGATQAAGNAGPPASRPGATDASGASGPITQAIRALQGTSPRDTATDEDK
jgi:conjugal transfer pilus assembly protein TraV